MFDFKHGFFHCFIYLKSHSSNLVCFPYQYHLLLLLLSQLLPENASMLLCIEDAASVDDTVSIGDTSMRPFNNLR
jgi:hypothetical protein